MDDAQGPPELIALATDPDHNAVTRFGVACGELDPELLARSYRTLRETAPQRHRFGRRYFVGHDGRPGSGSRRNRIEEHLAIALVNDHPTWVMPEGGSLGLLDYQVPLKAQRSDAGVGKIDIFAVSDQSLPSSLS